MVNIIWQKIGNSFGNFHLTTTYPKRRFRDDDLPRTLLDLELAPSAVIVVIPVSFRTWKTISLLCANLEIGVSHAFVSLFYVFYN